MAGGFPCQDFSLAGRRQGMGGARGGLWWEMHRVVAELRPAWVVGENVLGLLSAVCKPQCPGGCIAAHGGVMGAVIGSLGELGYGVAYRVLDARWAGVAQRRRRVFLVGHPRAERAAQVLLEPEGCPGDPPTRREAQPCSAGAVGLGADSTRVPFVNALTAAGGGVDDNDAQAGHLVACCGGAVAGPPRAERPGRRDLRGGGR